MRFFKMDSTGKESRTLAFVFSSWLVVWVKFLLAGLELPVVGKVPPMSATEFGMSFTAILAVWLGREWIKK